jgi:predicted enzyme related to lactoylglutathione lyase
MRKLISWFDIPTKNFNRAVEFYQNIFDLTLNIIDCEGEKMGCFPVDGVNVTGCIFHSPVYKPSQNGVIISFYTDDEINIFLKKVELNGGKTITPKTKINVDGRGYFAFFSDTEGNKIGIYSNN